MDVDSTLDTAKIMVIVLAKTEHASSYWVQYEWDSFYNDYLSGVRSEANLFSLTSGVAVHDLPRILRNVQNFDCSEGLNYLCSYINNILPKQVHQEEPVNEVDIGERNISIITGRQVTEEDIREAVVLDMLVYDDIYHVNV